MGRTVSPREAPQMARTSVPVVGIAGALALILPAAAGSVASAATPQSPTVLPAVATTIRAPAATCRSASYRAPMSGYLDTRLVARGDWDLVLRDTAGRRLGASRSFGGRELLQRWVRSGDRVTAQACRRSGAGATARVTFRLVDVAPPEAPAGKARLVRVQGTQDQIHALEEAGLDVTHAQGRNWADVLVAGDVQLAALRATGLSFKVRRTDLATSFAAARATDRRFAQRLGQRASALPSGRGDYRTYESIQSELKELVNGNPGLVRSVSFGTSHQGRAIEGVEIANDVAAADGRPVFFLMSLHHAREWPSVEHAMEFAQLLVKGRSDPRIARLLATERVVILPLVNPDGYISSRNAVSPADTAGQDPNLTLVEAVAPPGGLFAYRRKNCNGEIVPPQVPCELTWGVDNNRNYGNLWGGTGSSSDVTSQSYHGPGPRSESETQAVWDFARTNHVTTLVSLHTVAALVLRPPGLSQSGLAPDEQRMKQIGDAMGAAAGYQSQYSFQLYDTAGTTEDDTYAATGGYGFTVEIGPPNGEFHMPYETGVVKEWTGDNAHAAGRGGMRELLLLAAEAAANPADHAVLSGKAPAGRVLRLRKQFETVTSPFCEKGVEPVVVGPVACLTGEQPPMTIQDEQDTTTVVPRKGRYEWHVGPSTRPFVGGGSIIEELTDVDPPVATFSGAPGAPTGTTDHEFTLSETADKLRITLTATLPEDYDIEVFRRGADGALTSAGSSGNIPGEDEEVVIDDPATGAYVVRVAYFAAVTGGYEVRAVRANVTTTTTTGRKEAYELTCETPGGTVLERRPVVIDRGQALTLNLGCRSGGSQK